MNLKTFIVWIAVIATLVGLYFAARYTVFSPQPLEVEVFKVEKGTVALTITPTSAGTVRPKREAGVSSAVAGTVVFVGFDDGESASAEDIVVKLDTEELEAEVESYGARLEIAWNEHKQAGLRLDRAKAEFDRAEGLKSARMLSDTEYDAIRTDYDLATLAEKAARHSIAEIEAMMLLMRVRIEKSTSRPPFSGIITDVLVEVGEYVVPGTPLYNLVDNSTLHIEATVDEVDVSKLSLGQPARLSFDALGDESLKGTLVDVSPIVAVTSERNRVSKVKISVDEKNMRRLRVGMSVDIDIVVSEVPDVLYVPTYAIMERSAGKAVFVLEEGRVVERPVEFGATNWDRTQILSGLSQGELVITNLDNDRIVPGAEAVIKER